MGRHSIPDPEDSAGEEQHEEPETTRFGHADDDEPEHGADIGEPEDEPGFGEPEYDAPRYRTPSYPEPDYRSDDFGEPDFEAPDYEGRDPGGFDLQRVGSSSTPPPERPRSGPQHGGDWDGGEWTGSHRAVTPGRRGVSIGVIAALVTVIVAVAAVILWRFFGDALSSRSDVAAARCVNGELAVPVVADPSVAEQIKTLAERYNQDCLLYTSDAADE